MIIISVVVSSFTAPINVLFDFLFENILMAPSSEESDKSRNGTIMSPELESRARKKNQVSNAKLTKHKWDIPEETAAAYGRATMLAAGTVSGIASRRKLDAVVSDATNEDDVDDLFSKMMIELEHQRTKLSRRDQIHFDESWR